MNETIIINDKKFINSKVSLKLKLSNKMFNLFFQTNSQFFHVLNTEGILLQTKRLLF